MGAPVLVINSGSSSIKYQLVDGETMEASTSGLIERIGQSDSVLTHRHAGERAVREGRLADYGEGLEAMVAAFEDAGTPLADAGLIAVAHRVVHGGERFVQPVVVDDEVERAIDELSALAPLHNPANLEGIRTARKLFPKLPQVAVFDTAFHATVPERAHLYAVPSAWREEHGVRRYGFHGTSHAYVSRKAAEMLGKSPKAVNVIVAHLGNGASVTAVERGRSIDTSMGLTPLEGLVMGTRSGDIDPAIVFHMHRQTGASFADLDAALNKESGMLALSGHQDNRAIERAAAAGTGRRRWRWRSTATASASTSARTSRRSAAPTRSRSPRGSARTAPRSARRPCRRWWRSAWTSTRPRTPRAGRSSRRRSRRSR
nr:hypothetical protein GCM10025732_25250 [Glycomyces mayteni]